MHNNTGSVFTPGCNKQCPVCRKWFTIYDLGSYTFKITKSGNRVPVCSWGCLREYEQRHKGKREAKRRAAIEKQLMGLR